MAVNEAARYVKDTTEQVTPVAAEVPDATENLNNEFERVTESGEQFFGFHDVLKPLTSGCCWSRRRSCVRRRTRAIFGTKIPESEARFLSRLGNVTVTSRFAVLWMTQQNGNCLGDICELTRSDSASDEVILSGCWFKRWNGKKRLEW